MNPPKVSPLDYIGFLSARSGPIVAQKQNGSIPMRKPVQRTMPTRVCCIGCFRAVSERLWDKEQKQVDLSKGYLIANDSTLDKLYNRQIELVTRQ